MATGRRPPRPPLPGSRRTGGRGTRAPAGLGRLSLQRALSKFGVCSRTEARRRILAGRVELNGVVCLQPELRIEPRHDRVSVDGIPASDHVKRVVLALHKPTGVLTTRVDPAGRPTVYDFLAEDQLYVFPVGRLDLDSSGLLILTNDHRLGHRLADPTHHVPKTYHVRVKGLPTASALFALRHGVTLLPENVVTRAARVRPLGSVRDGTAWLEIVLEEGRNRQVRRMCASVGHDVLELTRVKIGALGIGALAPGEWRVLDDADVALLEKR